MPTKLRALIHRRASRPQRRLRPNPSSRGQIVRIDAVRGRDGPLETIDLPHPWPCLLSESTTSDQVWSGWLVTTETDYAGPDDMLLGPEDEPCDPLARMVQTWNPIRVYLPSTSRVLAQLKPERLAAVRALAATPTEPMESANDPAQPGRVVSRHVGSYQILTGSPLGDDDPRHIYRNPEVKAVQTFLSRRSRWRKPPHPLRANRRHWTDPPQLLVGPARRRADWPLKAAGKRWYRSCPWRKLMSGGAATDPQEEFITNWVDEYDCTCAPTPHHRSCKFAWNA
ncbi:MAG: hypothetical protein IPK83_24575 [Planctomycetes bacterium]|nr:hypothetical protein [Planctomycetota bacterium]